MIAERGRFLVDAGMLTVTAQKQRFRQCIPYMRSRNVEGPTTDRRQSERRHHQATGAAERSARRPGRSATIEILRSSVGQNFVRLYYCIKIAWWVGPNGIEA